MYSLSAAIGTPFRAAARVKVGQLDAIALFDTGATVSVISDRLAKRLPNVKWEDFVFAANAVNNQSLIFSKRGCISLQLGSKPTTVIFHVMKNCPYDCIIGTDYMKDLSQVTFYFQEDLLRLPAGVVIPLVSSNLKPQEPSVYSYAVMNET